MARKLTLGRGAVNDIAGDLQLANQGISVAGFSATGTAEIEEIVKEIRSSNSSKANHIITKRVKEIIGAVETRRNSALLALSRRHDGTRFSKPDEFLVGREEFERAYSKISSKQLRSIEAAFEQINWLSKKQLERLVPQCYRTPFGFQLVERFVPLERVGGYIPGGLASYPSTVLMICSPAKAAGVKEITLATPPRKDGRVNESVLVAADICGVTEVIKAGGAQAIAALAFGTETIAKAEMIVGPGNQYVTEAKRQVSARGLVTIDFPAGPTELLIIADKDSNPNYVSEDLISQAEHGNRTLCGVVSDSQEILSKVRRRIESIYSSRERQEQIRQSLLFAVKVDSVDSAVEFAQRFSPEHVEIMVSPASLRERIGNRLTNAGLVLLGDFSPCSSTDYIVGTNHILPTGGYAANYAGVSVDTFLKKVTTVLGSSKALQRSVKFLSTLANLEGLPNHAIAAESRFLVPRVR